MTDRFWNAPLREQVTWHCASSAPGQGGSGAMTIDFAVPEPDPPPITTAAEALHVHREVVHHLAEVCLLRDLHRAGVLRGA